MADRLIHHLKTEGLYWDAMQRGDKNFEVRRNDRAFQKGDIIVAERFEGRHYDTNLDGSTRKLIFRIGYILQGGQFGIEAQYCVMDLIELAGEEGARAWLDENDDD